MSEDYVVILTSYIDNKYTNQISLLIAHLQKYGIPYRIIEGTDPKNHDVRVAFFQYAERCGGRKEYPLVFIKRKTEIVEFVGNWDRVQIILDAEDNSEEFLKAHPTVTTFPRLFNK